MDAKEVSESIKRYTWLATYRMTASGNVATKSRIFFVAARVSSDAFTWLEPISVRVGNRGLCIVWA